MKSNQERSNGCLPPKKREILALEQRPLVAAAATPPALVADPVPHTENLAWLASVASERCRSRDAESPRCPTSSTLTSSPNPVGSSAAPLSSLPLASLPTVFPTTLQQHAGTIQFAQLGPNVQFISSGPYAGYISSHIISGNANTLPSSAATAGQRHQLDSYTTALISPPTKGEQQIQIGLSPSELTPVSLANSPQVSSQYIHLDSRTPLTVGGAAVTSTAGHLQIHPHGAVIPQTFTLAPSQLVVQYADGSAGKKPDGQAKALFNGELEVVKHAKGPNLPGNHVQNYETRHILLPADYGQNSGLQTSLVLVAQPSHGAEPEPGTNKISLVQTEKGGICLGKPVPKTSSFAYSPSPDLVKSVPPNTVVHTTLPHDELPPNLFSSSQPPIIGYITSGSQHAVSYHAALPQHLVIPRGQSLLIPVTSTSNSSEVEVSRSLGSLPITSAPQISTAMPHAYLATALSKCEVLAPDGSTLATDGATLAREGGTLAPAVAPPSAPSVVANVAPAVVSSPSPAPAPSSPSVSIQASPSVSSPASPVALPPFFMRGSIIQLADGELKRVEDLKTEDFIQSAEISNELKIDSSTVERIDCGQSPNAVVIQFSVGELKAQVCVEVLVEYPFFVFGQGWSSCCPDRTTQLFELSCAKLCVGDVCVSLTLRGLRNGAVTDNHSLGTRLSDACHNMENALRTNMRPSNGAPPVKPHGVCGPQKEQVSGPESGQPGLRTHSGSAEDRNTAVSVLAALGEAGHESLEKTHCSGLDRVRKRRWSAPEPDQAQKAEGEPPPSLAKASIIPQEVKISIEGHSSTGKDSYRVGRVDC